MTATPRAEPLEWRRLSATRDGPRRTFVFGATIPRDWLYFEGHFRGYPVLAGVVQLAVLVMPCLRAARPDAGEAAGLSGVKFPARVLPGDDVSVTLTLDDTLRSVDFAVRRGDTLCTHGRLLLAGASA